MSSFRTAPRAAVCVLIAVYACPSRKATYLGLQRALGLRSYSGVRKAVRQARQEGFVELRSTGRGPRARSIIVLTQSAFRAIRATLSTHRGASIV